MKKQIGLSLSELLISLFLASLLSTILMQAYLLNKRHYFTLQQALAENFDLLWVEDLLKDSIRRAGFTPCVGVEQLQSIDRRTIKKKFSGKNIEIKNQELQINRMDEHFGRLVSVLSKQEIVVSAELSLRVGQSLLMADCQHAEVHQIIQKKKLPQGFLLTLDTPVFFTYPSLSYVGQWLEERWFIKKNQEGIDALYYQQAHSEELTPLIHSMIIKSKTRYGKKQIDMVWSLDKKMHHFSVFTRT